MSRVSEPKPKSFEISKRAVWEAYRRVKANKGAAGVDEQSIAEFEQDLHGEPVQALESAVVGKLLPAAGACGRDTEAGRRLRECSGCRLSRIGSPRRSCAHIWSPRWSRCSTRTRMGIDRGVPPTTRSGSVGSGAGETTGCSIWTSGSSSTPFRGTSRSESGRSPHRPALDPALCGAVAESAAATGGREPGRAGSRNPSRVCDLALARQHVHALRV